MARKLKPEIDLANKEKNRAAHARRCEMLSARMQSGDSNLCTLLSSSIKQGEINRAKKPKRKHGSQVTKAEQIARYGGGREGGRKGTRGYDR
jgi:hypothetical protein